MKKLIVKKKLDIKNNHLTVSVPSDALQELKTILSKDKPIGKAFTNIAKTYVFLYWLNQEGQFHVSKRDLATMTYARHEDSLKKAIETLKENGFLSTTYQENRQGSRYYYTYNAQSFDYKQSSNSTIEFGYDIPICSSYTLGKDKIKTSRTGDLLNNQFSSFPHICPTDSHFNNQVDTFRKQFIGWYEELSFGGQVIPHGSFSEKDGRYYHLFHALSKEERSATVLWDGEHVKEVWDAHSAIFIVMGYYLKYFKKYESERERREFIKEADEMMTLAVQNRLYSTLQYYHNTHVQNPVGHLTRDGMKKEVQKYLNKSYKRLFNKKGQRTRYNDAMWCQYIDEYFMEHFPNIRSWILHYDRHLDMKDVVDSRGMIHPNQPVWVSNIHADIMPYEFELVSMGLCKDLYDYHKIKSITVHDAIYMKESDADQLNSSTIDELLSERIGLKEREGRSIALF